MRVRETVGDDDLVSIWRRRALHTCEPILSPTGDGRHGTTAGPFAPYGQPRLTLGPMRLQVLGTDARLPTVVGTPFLHICARDHVPPLGERGVQSPAARNQANRRRRKDHRRSVPGMTTTRHVLAALAIALTLSPDAAVALTSTPTNQGWPQLIAELNEST